MKKIHIAFLILISVFYLFFPSFGIQFLALFFFILFLLSFFYSKIIYAFLVIKRKENLIRLYLYQEYIITLEIQNRSFLPIHYLSVMDQVGQLYSNTEQGKVIFLRSREKHTLKIKIFSHVRGTFKIGPVLISSADPLGFFPWQKRIMEIVNVIVYPNIYFLDLICRDGLPAGNLLITNPIYEDMTRFRSLRNYYPGDSIKHIHWKASARTNTLYSKEYLATFYFPVLIVLNLTINDYPIKSRYNLAERSIELAASIIFFCLRLKQNFGLLASGTIAGQNDDCIKLPIKGGYIHAVNLLEHLARIQYQTKDIDPVEAIYHTHFNIPWGSKIFFISPILSDKQLSLLLKLKQKGVYIELLLHSSVKNEAILQKSFNLHYIKDYGEELFIK